MCVVMTGNQEPVSCDITNQVSVPLLVGARCHHHESRALHPAAIKVEWHVSSVANVLDEYNHILLSHLRLQAACRRLIQWALMLWPRG